MKKILFLTGTRADYGKMKPLMQALEKDDRFELYIYVCGMHLVKKFGNTYKEVQKDGYKNVYVAYGIGHTQSQSVNLGNTISSLSGYVDMVKPDMIIIHGDRMDALAGAVVGALHNIFVGHIEGGELTGTIDDSIRHAISKFAHFHFVCSKDAKRRLIQMGEEKSRIFVIGSPDIDVMLSGNIPSLEDAKNKYNIEFDKYGIFMYHPVTTEYDVIDKKIAPVVNAAIESGKNFIAVYPNNDLGSEIILNEMKKFEGNPHFAVFPSIRFEYFLTLLKNASFMIGNSSAGIRECGIYGVPDIDIGTRQSGRYSAETSKNIQHVNEDESEIINAIDNVESYRRKEFLYGDGKSSERFVKIISDEKFWDVEIQKQFVELDF